MVMSLPIDDRTVVWIVTSAILLRLANLRHQLVFIYGYAEPRLLREFAMAVLHRRQWFREEVGVFRIAAFLACASSVSSSCLPKNIPARTTARIRLPFEMFANGFASSITRSAR